jgi:glycosyltransferase involved in cell wall biosynthesis
MIKLSIVLPCHNEEEVIKDSYYELKDILTKLIEENKIKAYEIVFVNNGSTDNTLEQMLELQKTDASIVVVDLRNNYGYQGSITAGLCNCTGDAVITIDADLQDDPNKIPEMLDLYYKGYEMVLGIREKRDTDTFFKRLSANLFYKTLNILGVKSINNHGDFRLLSRALVEDFKKMPERNRYIRGMVLSLESKYAMVYYARRERKKGATKFNLPALIAFAIDGITSFTSSPIRFVTIFGFITFTLSILGLIYVLFEKFIREVNVPGWAFLSIVLLFFGGIQSLFLGIVGEYIAKTYIETKNRPLFLVRKIYKRDENEFDANKI